MNSPRLGALALLLASGGLLAPVVQLPSANATPRPISPDVATVELPDVAARTGFDVPDGAQLAGVTWEGDAPSVRARVLVGGRWSGWEVLAEPDEGPDPGTRDAAVATAASSPLEVTGAERVELVVEPRPGTGDVEAAVVDPNTSAADAALAPARPAASADAAVSALPAVISRAQWGADESLRRCTEPDYASTVKGVIIHHTADRNTYTSAEAVEMVRSIYAYHTQVNGWCDIGYNALVDQYGRIYEGRAGGLDKPVVGAHAGGFNTYTWGISVIGNFETVAPPEAALDAVRRLTAWKLSSYYLDAAGTMTLTSRGSSKYSAGQVVTLPTVAGHRDVGLTACPGQVYYEKLAWLRQAVRDTTGPVSSPVFDDWRSRGGAGSFLGEPFAGERAVQGGLATEFGGGEVFWSAPSGAHEVHGNIRQAYLAHGGPAGLLGFPATDEKPTPVRAGAYNHFQNGSIYWSESTGAHEVHGAIRSKWSSLGWENSAVGFPTTSEVPTPFRTGAFNHFENGSVYWSPATGAHEVRGAIRSTWSSLGWENSHLGFPITDETPTPVRRGAYNHFENGSIYWSPATGAWEVRGAIRDAWAAGGWENGVLGFPVTNENPTPRKTGAFNHFENGSIYWSPATGAHAVRGLIRDEWARRGWENSSLGFPVGAQYDVPGGVRQDFQGGSLVLKGGTVSVVG